MTKISVVDVDAAVERQAVTALVVSDEYGKRVRPFVRADLFSAPGAQAVVRWWTEYWDRYGRAPGRDVQRLYEDHSPTMSEQQREWVERFLGSLSDEYEAAGLNVEYLFDRSMGYFREREMRTRAERVLGLLDRGRREEAEKEWSSLGEGAISAVGVGIDPFDPEVVRAVFDEEESRVTLGMGIDSLDRTFGEGKSGWLLACMGPMKRGKTYALVHVTFHALRRGYSVAFVSLETEEPDMAKRLWSLAWSLSSEGESLLFPAFDKRGEVVKRERRRPLLNKRNVLARVRKYRSVVGKRLRMKSFPMSGASMADVESYLDYLEVTEDFSPQVIVVDYLGIIRGQSGFSTRDNYDYNAKRLKGLAQKRRAIVWTGQQCNRSTLDKLNISVTDVAEDVRFLAHVDMLYGLNQTNVEKQEGTMRVVGLLHRHKRFNPGKHAKVLQQLDAGQFALDSRMVDAPRMKDRRGEEKLDDDGELD